MVSSVIAQVFGVTLEWVILRSSGVWFLVVCSSGCSGARAEIVHSQYFVSLQYFCRCEFYARAGFLRSSGSRSSGFVGARAGSTVLVKVLGEGNLCSSGLVFALERMYFILVSWRSSGPFCARADLVFVLDARALCFPLERECRISVGCGAFLNDFFSFFLSLTFLKKPLESTSL